MNNEYLIWSSEVRNYEVDYQGIVNNANYFHYLDHARSKYLESLGINLKNFADKNLNIVLIETKITFKKSLAFGDFFYVTSKLSKVSRFKFAFDQQIFLQNKSDALIVESTSLICCIDAITSKPCVPKELENSNLISN